MKQERMTLRKVARIVTDYQNAIWRWGWLCGHGSPTSAELRARHKEAVQQRKRLREALKELAR